MSTMTKELSYDYQRVAQAIAYLEDHVSEQPSLDEVAAQVHLSPYHFQRLFRRWAGVSPKSFLQFLTVENAKESLRASDSVLEASFKSGLSGSGRLYDLMIQWEGMTPGEFKKGPGEVMNYGVGETLFGDCFLAWTQRGLTRLSFLGSAENELDKIGEMAALKNQWPELELRENHKDGQKTLSSIFRSPEELKMKSRNPGTLKVFVRGTAFELKVWRALLALAPGSLVSYGQLGAYLGMPKAARAVGHAVAKNALGYLIPCHRVLKKNGAFHNYRWGSERKKLLIGWESAQAKET